MVTTARIDVQSDPADTLHIRKATVGDCDILVELMNFAGEGLPLYLWTGLAGPDEDAWEIGRKRAARETGGFSYRNSLVAEVDGSIAAALIGYPLPEENQPIDYETAPRMFVPVLELENVAAGTFYINAVAAVPEARGLGIGTRLMLVAEQAAASTGCNGLSLIVSDANADARRLYRRLGYREIAERPVIKEGWANDGEYWILMMKDQAPGQVMPDTGTFSRRQRKR